VPPNVWGQLQLQQGELRQRLCPQVCRVCLAFRPHACSLASYGRGLLAPH
jgi:hypothetical protein